MNTSSSATIAAITLAVGMFYVAVVSAADETPPAADTDTELAALKKETERLESELAIETAENNIYKARIGELSTDKLPEGKVTPTTLAIEPTLIAFESAACVAAKIGASVAALVPAIVPDPAVVPDSNPGSKSATSGNPKPAPDPELAPSNVKGLTSRPTSIVFFSENELKAMLEFRAFGGQLSAMTNAINGNRETASKEARSLGLPLDAPSGWPVTCPKSMPEGPAPEIKAVPAAPLVLINTAIGLTRLFKTDTVIAGTGVAIEDFALAALLAESMQKEPTLTGIPIIFPSSYYPDSANPVGAPFVDGLLLLQNILAKEKADNDLLAAHIAKHSKDSKCPEFWAKGTLFSSRYAATLASASKEVDGAFAILTAAKDDAGLSRLKTYMRMERLAVSLGAAPLIVAIKPIAAAGNTQTKTNLLYTSLKFSGGAAVAFMVFDSTGAVIKSGVASRYGGAKKAKEIKTAVAESGSAACS